MPRHKRPRTVIEQDLPSRFVSSCHGELMEVSGSFCITGEGITVAVETSLNGETDCDACSGRTFQEVLSELGATNYGAEAFLDALRALPEWEHLEARMEQEELQAEEESTRARAAAAEQRIRDQASLGQIVARSADGRYQMGWRKVWHSDGAIRVVVLVDGKENPIAELFGAKPTSVVFDELAEEFVGQIKFPIKNGAVGFQDTQFAIQRFRVGVEPSKLRWIARC